MNLDFVTLENGIDYLIFKKVIYNNVEYLYLVNENDSDDFCIRKVINENGEKFILALDYEDEFNKTIELFNKEQ